MVPQNGFRFYLMHGTSPDGALGITDGGFRLDLTGSHAGTMFGSLEAKQKGL